MNEERLGILMQEAFELHTSGEIQKAEALLLEALAENELPMIRVALAQLRLTSGNPQGVLELIAPLLHEDDFVVTMMAARAYLELDKTPEAGRQLDKLVRIVDRIISANREGLRGMKREYPGVVLNLVGSLGQHRRVLELYKRWAQCKSDWVVRHYVAVACFNLRRYKQAASHWSAIGEMPHALGMQHVAVLAERGTVPPFSLEYALPNPEMISELLNSATVDVEKKGMQMGILRMVLLEMALDEEEDDELRESALAPLICGGGDWGAALGMGLLESSVIRKPVKLAVTKLLVEAGFFPEETPIPVMLDGEMTSVVIHREEKKKEPESVSENMLQDMLYRIEEHFRIDVEQKTLPVTADVARGLKNMPAAWLEAICELLGIRAKRLRKEREKQIVNHLTTWGGLYGVVQRLSEDEKELLGYVLDKGGWVRLSSVATKFGSMEGDGFYWLEKKPEGTLARLWCHGLVMVGSAKINKRRVTFVMVPVDLQERLEQLLNGFVPEGWVIAEDVLRETAAAMAEETRLSEVFQLRVELEGTHPPVWRSLVVPETFTFWELHVAIQDAFGWEDRHRHMFYGSGLADRGKVKIGMPDEALFAESGEVLAGWEIQVGPYFSREGKQMKYLYDFTDNWLHIVTLEKKRPAREGLAYPQCSGGEQMCPPEGCGGNYGYRKLLGKGEIVPGSFNPQEVVFSDAQKRLEEVLQIR
ncbi:plasmid pRiA4b ORF-3 family protein [Dethiobacter alkaliphilus]|uniref:Plasmid pRiA4b ORF-3 family protein n=1 Tax=Dethiobacter alkaliphilus AHT 1 TaxID=555088 RepID=C0GGX5_DETAL|nr:plasmid pRiA4b ORF-3 family protein [Dethiobacter alkaliphilus]EEG77277.1 plasmid pRiA4b ORF-3 family protein [Dethiobacter alkaliphilus AHT 1]